MKQIECHTSVFTYHLLVRCEVRSSPFPGSCQVAPPNRPSPTQKVHCDLGTSEHLCVVTCHRYGCGPRLAVSNHQSKQTTAVNLRVSHTYTQQKTRTRSWINLLTTQRDSSHKEIRLIHKSHSLQPRYRCRQNNSTAQTPKSHPARQPASQSSPRGLLSSRPEPGSPPACWQWRRCASVPSAVRHQNVARKMINT